MIIYSHPTPTRGLATSYSFDVHVHDYRYSVLIMWGLGGGVIDVAVNDESLNDSELASAIPYSLSSLDDTVTEVALSIIAMIKADRTSDRSHARLAVACARRWLRERGLDHANDFSRPRFPVHGSEGCPTWQK